MEAKVKYNPAIVEIIRSGSIELREYMNSKNREYSTLYIALMKWHPENFDRGFGACALCVEHIKAYPYNDCNNCPLYEIGQNCHLKTSLFEQFQDARNSIEEEHIADKLYTILETLYLEERELNNAK